MFVLFFAVLLVCCYASAYIAPADFWLPALIGLTYPVALTINILILVWVIVKKNKVLAIVCAFALVLNISRITDFIGFSYNASPLPVNLKRIKVISWNVHNLQPLKKSRQLFTRSVLNVIDSLKPDVLCLQEYYDQSNEHRDISDSIKAVTGIKYHYFQRLKNNYTGIAIFSRFPIVGKGHLSKLGAPHCNKCIFADILVNKRNYRIYTVHLQSYFFSLDQEKQSLPGRLKSTFKKLKFGLVNRGVQAGELKQALAKSPYPIILTGDFNDTPLSYTYNQLSQGLNNSFTEKGSGYGKTYTGLPFPFQIDYILSSPSFKTLSYQTVKQQPSDHYPVVAELGY